MSPEERQVWDLYIEGKYPLPEIDWDSNRDTVPTSSKPLRIARRRAEALNHLYKADKADPSHSVWFTKSQLFHLPLVKAMARVIGAERNLLGGQCALNATQLADLQSINKILSLLGQILARGVCDLFSFEIGDAQRVLGSQRDKLRALLGVNGKRRK